MVKIKIILRFKTKSKQFIPDCRMRQGKVRLDKVGLVKVRLVKVRLA
jgi:hypothetical protein